MTTSFTKKFEIDIKYIKEQSDKRIPPDKFYLVNIQFDTLEDNSSDMVEEFLFSVENQPAVIYFHRDVIWLIFSCLVTPGKRHFANGSHQEIISYYFRTIYALKQVLPHKINIVEFETQTQLLSYFLLEVFKNSQKVIIEFSNGAITQEDLIYNTSFENLQKLEEVVSWDSIPKSERYGTFYKLKKVKTEIKVISFSESYDSRNFKRYANFLVS